MASRLKSGHDNQAYWRYCDHEGQVVALHDAYSGTEGIPPFLP